MAEIRPEGRTRTLRGVVDEVTLDVPMGAFVALLGPSGGLLHQLDPQRLRRPDAGGIATLILPADTAWNPAREASAARPRRAHLAPGAARINAIAEALRRGEPAAILMNRGALSSADALDDADRIAQATGAELLADTSFSRIESGAGRVAVEPVPYQVDNAVRRLAGLRHCILVEAEAPVSFFAYPGKPGRLLPEGCEVHVLAHQREDGPAALARLAAALGVGNRRPRRRRPGPERPLPTGPLTPAGIGAVLANRLPADAILSDESFTTGRPILEALADAATHSHLQLTGGAIGIGLPLAVGAAVACPDRKVVVLQADGSGMYTVQALWTQAREGLDVLTIVLSNRAYAILRHELTNVGVKNPGPKALAMTSLDRPALDWTALAAGMGVDAARAATVAEFDSLVAVAMGRRGPFLIEADLS